MATTPETPLSIKPASTRWLWVVRVGAIIPLLLLLLKFVTSLGHQCSEPPQDWGILLFDSSPLTLPYLYILWRLWPKAEKSGLRVAMAWGSLMFALSTFWVLGGGSDVTLGGRWGFGFFALTQAAIVGSAIKAYRAAAAEQPHWQTQSRGYLAVIAYLVLLVVVAIAIPSNLRMPIPANQAAAVASLRTINTAESTYAETYKAGYSATLAALGEVPAGTQPSASAAGLIDSLLAKGRKNGYSFMYSQGARDPAGGIKSYTVVARPLDSSCGAHSYFTDESGVIRQTSDHRPPTAKDPPVD